MKTLAIAVSVALAVSCVAVGQTVEQQLKKLENEWAEAEVKKNYAVFDRVMSDDFTNTDPSGNVSTKSESIASSKSGDEVVSSMELSDMTVRVYGDAAVVTYVANAKETFKGQDVSGQSRWTDTWVKRGASWKCVASHGSKISK